MTAAQKSEIKLCASELREKNKAKTEKGKKGYTGSAGLVKFRGTVGPYKVGERV